jgi:hypothetical protein
MLWVKRVWGSPLRARAMEERVRRRERVKRTTRGFIRVCPKFWAALLAADLSIRRFMAGICQSRPSVPKNLGQT